MTEITCWQDVCSPPSSVATNVLVMVPTPQLLITITGDNSSKSILQLSEAIPSNPIQSGPGAPGAPGSSIQISSRSSSANTTEPKTSRLSSSYGNSQLIVRSLGQMS